MTNCYEVLRPHFLLSLLALSLSLSLSLQGPEARSVAAAMAAMLYEEGYSDILPPQVGLNNQLEYPQVGYLPSDFSILERT